MIDQLRASRAALPAAKRLAEARGGVAWKLLMASEGDYDRLIARARVVGDEMMDLPTTDAPPFDSGKWLADVFDRRVNIVLQKIERLEKFGQTVLDSDIGEGKGSVRSRLRRGEELFDKAKDADQQRRYAAQIEALRSRALAWGPNTSPVTLGEMRKDLLLWLDRLADSWRALPPEQQRRYIGEHPEWSLPVGSHHWFRALPIDHDTFNDLGV